MSFMTSVSSVAAMHEEVHQRTSEQWQPDQGAEDMRAVLGKEERTADQEETEEHESCSRRKKVSLSLTVMFCVIVHRHRTLLFRNQAAAEHAHRASKPIFAGLLG
jgi:hypothetical protein